MYSPQQDYNMDTDNYSQQAIIGTPHTTVGAVPVMNRNSNNNNRLFTNYHQRQNSFGTAASMAMSPPNNNIRNGGMTAGINENNSQNWFGTSLDSNGSSFGQSPIFSGIISPSNSTSHLIDANFNNITGEEDEMQQRNLQEVFEKRRRRRESHNAVERRRRDNINERINELCSLLPERLLDTAPTTSNVMSVSSGQIGANGRAINKGTILKLSVDHIKELREDVGRYQERIRELETMIEHAKRGEFIPPNNNSTLPKGHQRVGSIQFRQQFNNLQIGSNDL